MDETYIKVAGQWKYLYRAVDRDGSTIDFLLRAQRDCAAARRFFSGTPCRSIARSKKALGGSPLLLYDA